MQEAGHESHVPGAVPSSQLSPRPLAPSLELRQTHPGITDHSDTERGDRESIMGDEDQVNGVVTEENGGADTETAELTQAVPESSEAPENGQAEAAQEKESVVNETEEPEKPEEQNKNIKTVANILHKVKEDTEMSSDQKIDTLSMLLTKFVAENGV